MQYQLSHLNVSFGAGREVLEDISLEISSGEFIGVLGDSGSGKTQLTLALGLMNTFYGARLKSSIHRFQEGSKVLDLKQVTQADELRVHHIGYILQEAFSYFNPVLKIKNQLQDKNIAASSTKNLFPRLGLDEVDRMLDSYPHQLSGGQLQRLAILACLSGDPQIVVADEIESALDDKNATLVFDLLLKLKEEKKFALIWVTHDQTRAIKLCDRIWYVREGRLEYDGPAKSFTPVTVLYPKALTPPSGSEVIRMENIDKTFKTISGSSVNRTVTENNLLKEINLTIKKGDVIGLMGASGSGKSTLARIIAGIDQADRGKIYIESALVAEHRLNKKILYLFQDAYSSLNPSMTCRTILEEAIGVGTGHFEVSGLLEMGGLPDEILQKKPSALSGGMRQRLALLRAIACGPDLLILDESLNALNAVLQVTILEILFAVQKQTGMAILLISHQQDLIHGVCHQVFNLEEGNLMPIM